MAPSRPTVILCLAQSLDGKLSSSQREAVTFPSRQDRLHLFQQRDAADAILTGAATVRAEDPPLLPSKNRRQNRINQGLRPNPLRIVASRSLNANPLGRALKPRPDAPVVALSLDTAAPTQIQAWRKAGIDLHLYPDPIPWKQALASLAEEYALNTVLAEGGGNLNASLFEADVVDEIWLTLCPCLIGGSTAPTFFDGPDRALDQRLPLTLQSIKTHHGELILHYRRSR